MEQKKDIAQEFEAPEGLTQDDVHKLRRQVEAEFTTAKKHIQPKQEKWYSRLKLYNNQMRDPQRGGDPTLFTTMQTVLSALYDDKLVPEWGGNEMGDEVIADNLSRVTENDAVEMRKSIIDYFWSWNSLFYGTGLLRMQEYDRKKLVPVPELLDPLTLLKDPKGVTINTLVKGMRPCRFWGLEAEMSKLELESFDHYINVDVLKAGIHLKDSLVESAREHRDMAQGRQTMLKAESQGSGSNEDYEVLEWYTHFNGKKIYTVWGNGIGVLLHYKEQENDYWDVLERSLYPVGFDFHGTSIPDLVEDKQRLIAIALNLGIDYMKADLHPTYLYSSERIKNRADLNFGFNKFIPVEGIGDPAGAVRPLNKPNPNLGLADFIIRTLEESGEKATATPAMQQGVLSGKDRTATELNLVSSKVDTRFSLSAKVFGWSERDFWLLWYAKHKKHFKQFIDKKLIRITGAFGTEYRPLTRENLISRVDPDVTIMSKMLSEQKRMRELASFQNYLAIVMKDPDANIRYALKKYGKLSGLSKDEIDRILTPTADEIMAEDENEKLNRGELPQVRPEDDDKVHIEVHRQAIDNPETRAHIKTHRENLMLKRKKPDMYPNMQQQQGALTPQDGQASNPREEMANGANLDALVNAFKQ